jgi:DNA-binding NarL/FixJ family response regulator
MALRVLLGDDELMTLEGVRAVLEAADGIEVVGEAHTGQELCAVAARTNPGLVLVDPHLRGFAEYRQRFEAVLSERGDVKVVVFSESSHPADVDSALAAGAAAYIVKTIHPLNLPAALRATAEGTVFHSCVAAADGAMSEPRSANLTEREREILAAVACGLSNRAISRELQVSEQTVKFHLANVYRKVGVLSRTAAVRYALEHDMVTLDRRSNGSVPPLPHPYAGQANPGAGRNRSPK